MAIMSVALLDGPVVSSAILTIVRDLDPAHGVERFTRLITAYLFAAVAGLGLTVADASLRQLDALLLPLGAGLGGSLGSPCTCPSRPPPRTSWAWSPQPPGSPS
ncbi:hypothetical protein J2Z21_004116 [Streptomyces griseochromogenes]|uniref:Uncharacterized protein n=1 Tax=Streptomyces griseochromogenes TaxID=68214 RepID=A0A1B1BAX5_9ACTN|nr:hypothetical protein [Streptomyces griseochromogenes]ANP55986.1 hypothetical protein AVL59_45985 [Streptomyces griseochromogenes]MBP2051166.1 hypothetical protein [Streptomyces griseochromogenes]